MTDYKSLFNINRLKSSKHELKKNPVPLSMYIYNLNMTSQLPKKIDECHSANSRSLRTIPFCTYLLTVRHLDELTLYKIIFE